MSENYHEEKNKEYEVKIRLALKELPKFCGSFFRSMEGAAYQTRLCAGSENLFYIHLA